MVKVHESYESTELTLGLRLGKIANSLNLFRERRDVVEVDVVPEEVQLRDAKEAFVWIDDDSVRGESCEHGSQVIKVLFRGGTCDENVVDVGVSGRNTTEHLVHKPLEGLSSVA